MVTETAPGSLQPESHSGLYQSLHARTHLDCNRITSLSRLLINSNPSFIKLSKKQHDCLKCDAQNEAADHLLLWQNIADRDLTTFKNPALLNLLQTM